MRFRASLLLLAFVLTSGSTATAQDPVQGARHPALSPDGQTIAFSWRGDVWTVPSTGGQARRLTVHTGDDRLPQWSPNGRWIAYSAKREGDYDVYVISAEGGGTRRLTFHSGSDLVTAWTADGQAVLFTSSRDWDRGVLWSVPVDGGTERKVTRGQTATADVSADGKTLLVSSGSSNGWWRRGYRGSNNWTIWSRPFGTMGGAARLTTFTGRNGWAAFAPDGRIYFLSDSTGSTELWRMNADGSAKDVVTRMREDGAQFLSVARQAPLAAFERGTDLFTVALDQPNPSPRRVPITAATDEQFNQYVIETYTSDASDLALSPDGREAAFVVHGEVYVVPARGAGAAVNVSDSPARDQAPTWSPDGKSLLFVSDRGGNEDLWLVTSADPAEPRLSRSVQTTLTRITNDPAMELRAVWSPDGQRIAFYRQGDPPSIWIADADGRNVRKFRDGYIQSVAWSPDGKWLAYSESRQGESGRSATDVFVAPVAGGAPVNVTMYPAQNRSPAWSPDGRRLAFISTRGTDPAISGGAPIAELYQIWLQRADAEKTRDDWAAEEEPSDDAAARRAGGRRDSTPAVEVRIDFDGITERAERVTDGFQARSFAFTPDGRQYAVAASVVGESDIWMVGRDGRNPTKVTRGGVAGDLAFDPDGRRVYYLTSRGTIGSATVGGGEAGGGGVAFRAELTVDRAAEPVQMFDEAWRMLGANFYDPKMHGRDWKAIRDRYRPMAEAAYTKEALGDVVLMMIGELNASHLNFSLPRADDAVSTGELGLVFDDAYYGRGLKVAAVVPGGPTDRATATVRPGQYLLAVNGHAINGNTNVYRLLANTAGRRIAITVASAPDGAGTRVLVVRPVSGGELGTLNYQHFVRQNHAKVRELSGGRVGYLHIRGMNQPSLEQFKRDFWGAEYASEAIIIDQRYNGGGNIHEQLWTELLRRSPIYFTNRAGDRRMSPPQWQRPTIVMQNQNSFSDAEIFPQGVQALGLGTTLGVPTGGGVIGTRNIQLIDGSTFRLPGSGVFATKDGKNLENWGIEPDIWVENPFEEEQLGRDRQLERAVEELLKAVGARR